MKTKQIGVVLSGGGARGAYQAGVLKAFCEISTKMGIAHPFSTFSGISVGAINSAFFASHAEDIQKSCTKLIDVWNRLRTDKVIHTGAVQLGKTASRMFLELTSGKMIKHKKSRSLLDNSPLSKLIEREIDFTKINRNIKDGHLKSLVITAVNYTDGKNYIFFQANEEIEPWVRERRVVKEEVITKEHILASSALPLYFPPQKIGGDFYADGNIRNSTPLSPPIKLGAEKLLIIPVNEREKVGEKPQSFDPTLGRMVTVLMNALLLDAVDFDLERLSKFDGNRPGRNRSNASAAQTFCGRAWIGRRSWRTCQHSSI